MKIQLKRSNVLSGGAAKEPTAPQMEYGELAVNYNVDDPAIFIKDSADNIIRIAGYKNIAWDGNTEIPSGPTPPADPVPGNFWYNPEDGRLYYYYQDANSSQWVDASPDNWQGAGTLPDVDNPAYQPDTLDDRYVNIIGDNMTGDLTLGTDKITLSASSRSEFKEGLQWGPDYNNQNGSALLPNGWINIRQPSGTSGDSVVLRTQIDAVRTSEIQANGTRIIGGTLPSAPNISLNADGSAELVGNVAIGLGTRRDIANFTSIGLDGAAGSFTDYFVGGTRFGTIASDTSNFTIESVGTLPITFWTNSSPKMEINSVGTVQIGGTFPDSALIELNGADGSAEFAGEVLVGQSSNPITSGSCFRAYSYSPQATVYIRNQGSGPAFESLENTNVSCRIMPNGSAYFKGIIDAPNVNFLLEADDDTKYTSTTDVDGNETLVYNGAVLDVKDRLQKADAALLALKTAAASATDFASLQSAIVTALADI